MKLIIATWFILISYMSAYAQVMSDGFEDGNYSTNPSWTEWLQNTNCCTDSTMSINTYSKRTGNYGLDIYYVLDDNPRGDCLAHQDNNTCIYYNLSSQLTHYTFDAYFYLPLTQEQMCLSGATLQRKMVYFKPVGWGGGSWAFFINMWPWPNCSVDGYNISFGYGNAVGTADTVWGDSEFTDTVHNHVYRNIWYNLRITVSYGTYGNDTVKISLGEVGGTLYEILNDTFSLRSSSDAASDIGLGSIELGRQIDLTRSGNPYVPPVAEHRYWDDIALYSGEYPSFSYSTITGLTITGGSVQ